MARILVIDDDAGVRSAIQVILTSAGHEVVLAKNGNEGVELFRVKPAELVITDLLMPNKEGLEIIMELRKDAPDVAIIAMSGVAYAGVMLDTARRLGAARTIEKPFQAPEFLTIVEGVLRDGRKPTNYSFQSRHS